MKKTLLTRGMACLGLGIAALSWPAGPISAWGAELANHGLVAVGRFPADQFDQLGDKVDTLGGFFSGMVLDAASVRYEGSTVTGTIHGLTDRGWSVGGGALTYDYHPRVQTFSFSLHPYSGTGPVAQDRITLLNTDSLVFTYNGSPMTGYDSAQLPAPAIPTSPKDSPGRGQPSLDSEGLARDPQGGWFVADEYGPSIHRFNASGELIATFLPPEAYLPKRGNYPATLNWTGASSGTTGRRNNRGFEGLTVTPDGKRLVTVLQSPLVQDGGRANTSQNSRVLFFDIEPGSATYGKAVAEYIYPLTLNGDAAGNRQTILSEVLAVNQNTFLVSERDALGYGSGDTNACSYKRIVLFSTRDASNLINTGYDFERGAPGMKALPTNGLPASLKAVSRVDLVNLLNPADLARFGLNNTASDANSMPEKWEGLGLIPKNDPAAPDDYYLLIGTDNDLTSSFVYHNGVVVATNSFTVDTFLFAYHVTLPEVGAAAPPNAVPALAFTGPTQPTLSAPARVDLEVEAYDQDGLVVAVEFYEGAAKLGEDSTFPFSLRLDGVAAGSHTYRAVGRDNSGASAEAIIHVTVTVDNLPPTVRITAPVNNSYAASGSTVALAVNASDADGYVTRVEYLVDGASVGSSTKSPFGLSWSNAPVGAHSIVAVAQDNQGITRSSDPVTLSVLPPNVVSPGGTVAGLKFPEWSVKWWQWALRQDFDAHHPLKDEVGDDAHRGQTGTVWFLGGVVNDSGKVTRKIVVPAGKYLYFPLVNGECSNVENPPFAGGEVEETLRSCAVKFPKTELFCTIDGVPVPGLTGNRVVSPLFSFEAPAVNFLGVPGPTNGVAVDEGYYAMLEPLKPGQHLLQFGGTFGYSDPDPSKSFTFRQDITYEITVLAPSVVPQSQPIAGKTYGEWGAEWYKWDLGNPTNRASSIDATGANMPYGQKGPVWFLAGSTVGGVVERSVVIPQGKHVFFPVINIINDYPCPDAGFQPGPGQTLEQFLTEFAKSVVDTTRDFYLEIDGVVTTNAAPFRARSSLFEFVADATWAGIDPCAANRPSSKGVADGYWVMLEPLSPGLHTIRFKAKDFIPGKDEAGHDVLYPFGDQDITYHITVPPTGVLPPYMEVAGKTQAEWSGTWWQWALSQGTNTSPVLDRTGANANVRQYGDVFFVAGLLGYSLDPISANRSFTVPAGKHLFFPVLNGAADNIDVVPPVSEQQLRDWAASGFESYRDVFATIDGNPVTQLTTYRQRSPLSAVVLPIDNVFQPLSPGYRDGVTIEDQVSDGIWVMLSPLSPGDHVITFGGKNTFGWSLAVTNRIRVVGPTVVPASETYLGKTYGDWGAAWWKWAWSLPFSQNPVMDTNGAAGHLNQSGDVWFLAGTSGATVTRELVIPYGKSLFFPTINIANDYPCPDPKFEPAPGQSLEEFLLQGAKDFMAGTTNLFAEVDGVALTNLFAYRGTSGLFNFTADISLRDAWDPCVTGTEQQGVSDGYWVMLKPLSPGTHTLRLGGGHATFGVDVTYHLTVLPPGVLPPYASVAGVNQSDYSSKWWTWASEQPSATNPLLDTTGAQANNLQKGAVLFLGGTFGSTDDPTVPAATRHFRVPAGKHLFFPMLNGENDNATYDPDVSLEQLQSDLKSVMDNPSKLVASIDGIDVPKPAALRQFARNVSFTLPTGNIYTPLDARYTDGLSVGPAAADGYWVLLEPLSAGTHVIDYGGRVQSGFSTAVRAFVTVVPEGTPFVSRIGIEAGGVKLAFWTATSGSHQVESASEVNGPWTAVGAAVAGDGEQHEVNIPATAGSRFFRIQRK